LKFETGEQSSRLFPYRSCRHGLRVLLARCLMYVGDPEAQACVAGTGQLIVWRIGNKLEQHASSVEAGDMIPGREMKSKSVSTEDH